MKTESQHPSWPSSWSYCCGLKMNLTKRKWSIPKWQTSAREPLKIQNKDPQWKCTTTLQNGHISFIYLYPNKLTHIEYNLFFFVRVAFWYFNNLECANWIDGILKWLLTLRQHADHYFTLYYNLHICLCKISTLVFSVCWQGKLLA